MRNRFSKYQLLVLSSILSVSLSAQAGYSTDAACATVSNAAKNQATADKKKIDDVNKSVNNAIKSQKDCTEAVMDLLDSLIDSSYYFAYAAKKGLTGLACDKLNDVTHSANNIVITTLAPISVYTGAPPAPAAAPPLTGIPAITNRIANIFN